MSLTELRVRYAVVIRLPRGVEVQIEDTYLSSIGVTKPSMGYHLTLLGPYCLAPGVESPFLPAISRVCRQHQPLDIRLNGLGVFRTVNNHAVYLQVVDAEPVFALHRSLLEATAGITVAENEQLRVWTVDSYHPHVTLGLGMSNGELEEFLRLGRERSLDLTFRARSLWLAEQVPSGPWEYTAEYALGVEERQPSED